MIQFQHPEKKTYSHLIGGFGFLGDLAGDPHCNDELDSGKWKFVVLQGQKISASGRVEYSRRKESNWPNGQRPMARRSTTMPNGV